MTPLIELCEDPYEIFKLEIRNTMQLILKYYDCVNIRSLEIKNEIKILHDLLQLKNSKILSPINENKIFISRQKMYIYKLNNLQILNPKQSTLNYYKIYIKNEKYFIED
tara:strand:+ start:2900 stop:3226 length:327 start_codon:yes stop_codon:yes gene_type:complete